VLSSINEPQPILRVRDVVKNFEAVRALRGVNIDIFAGEVHSIVGENVPTAVLRRGHVSWQVPLTTRVADVP
jgi:ABC-type phosphonate transport system ATPase subunit